MLFDKKTNLKLLFIKYFYYKNIILGNLEININSANFIFNFFIV